MNKTELIAAVAEHAELPKATVAKVLTAAFDVVIPLAVAAGDPVTLIGFGTFEPAKRPARTVRNIHTRELMDVPETWGPKFTAGTGFKTTVKTSKALANA
jgi:DNA-binding protein HU-beta